MRRCACRVLVVFAAQAHDDVSDRAAEKLVFRLAALLERLQAWPGLPSPVERLWRGGGRLSCDKAGACRLRSRKPPRAECSSHRNRRRRRRRRRAPRNCAAPSGDCARRLRANPAARRRCKGRETSAACPGSRREKICAVVRCGVEVLGLARHAQRIVIAANLHAFAAAFAEVGNENGEQPAAARRLLFQRCGKSPARCCRPAAACR